jgi:hypothetical protein
MGLFQSQILLYFLDQTFAEFFVASMHGQFRFLIAQAHDQMPSASLGFKRAPALPEPSFELIRIHGIDYKQKCLRYQGKG